MLMSSEVRSKTTYGALVVTFDDFDDVKEVTAKDREVTGTRGH